MSAFKSFNMARTFWSVQGRPMLAGLAPQMVFVPQRVRWARAWKLLRFVFTRQLDDQCPRFFEKRRVITEITVFVHASRAVFNLQSCRSTRRCARESSIVRATCNVEVSSIFRDFFFFLFIFCSFFTKLGRCSRLWSTFTRSFHDRWDDFYDD